MHLGCHSDLSLNSKHALIIQYNGIWFVPIEIQRCNLNEIAQFAAPHLLGLGHQDAVCLVDFSEPIPVNLGNLFTRNFAALPSRAHFDLQSQHGRYEFAHARFAGQKVETKQKGDTKRDTHSLCSVARICPRIRLNSNTVNSINHVRYIP